MPGSGHRQARQSAQDTWWSVRISSKAENTLLPQRVHVLLVHGQPGVHQDLHTQSHTLCPKLLSTLSTSSVHSGLRLCLPKQKEATVSMFSFVKPRTFPSAYYFILPKLLWRLHNHLFGLYTIPPSLGITCKVIAQVLCAIKQLSKQDIKPNIRPIINPWSILLGTGLQLDFTPLITTLSVRPRSPFTSHTPSVCQSWCHGRLCWNPCWSHDKQHPLLHQASHLITETYCRFIIITSLAAILQDPVLHHGHCSQDWPLYPYPQPVLSVFKYQLQ